MADPYAGRGADPRASAPNEESLDHGGKGSTFASVLRIRLACTAVALLLALPIPTTLADEIRRSAQNDGTPRPAAMAEDAEGLSTGSCVCLRDPSTDNFVKNCLVQRRGDEEPRFYCGDGAGVAIEMPEFQGWSIVPGEDPDCRPCDGPPEPKDGYDPPRKPENGDQFT